MGRLTREEKPLTVTAYTGEVQPDFSHRMIDQSPKVKENIELGLEMIFLNTMMLGSHEATLP